MWTAPSRGFRAVWDVLMFGISGVSGLGVSTFYIVCCCSAYSILCVYDSMFCKLCCSFGDDIVLELRGPVRLSVPLGAGG